MRLVSVRVAFPRLDEREANQRQNLGVGRNGWRTSIEAQPSWPCGKGENVRARGFFRVRLDLPYSLVGFGVLSRVFACVCVPCGSVQVDSQNMFRADSCLVERFSEEQFGRVRRKDGTDVHSVTMRAFEKRKGRSGGAAALASIDRYVPHWQSTTSISANHRRSVSGVEGSGVELTLSNIRISQPQYSPASLSVAPKNISFPGLRLFYAVDPGTELEGPLAGQVKVSGRRSWKQSEATD